MMNADIARKNGSRTKYLIPVILLLLCGLTMVNAGYAYNSSMNASANVSISSFEITLGETANITQADIIGDLRFNSTTVNGATTYTFQSNYDTVSFKVKVVNQNGSGTPVLTVNDPTVAGNTGIVVSQESHTYDEVTKTFTVTLKFGYASGSSLSVSPGNSIALNMRLVATISD